MEVAGIPIIQLAFILLKIQAYQVVMIPMGDHIVWNRVTGNGITSTINTATNVSIAIDNDGNIAAKGIDHSLAINNKIGFAETSYNTGFAGQANFLNASNIAYVALNAN